MQQAESARPFTVLKMEHDELLSWDEKQIGALAVVSNQKNWCAMIMLRLESWPLGVPLNSTGKQTHYQVFKEVCGVQGPESTVLIHTGGSYLSER